MPYTLLDQGALDTEFPLCEERGISVVIGAVFASGILATGAVEPASYGYAPAPEAVRLKVQSIQKSVRGAPCSAAGRGTPVPDPSSDRRRDHSRSLSGHEHSRQLVELPVRHPARLLVGPEGSGSVARGCAHGCRLGAQYLLRPRVSTPERARCVLADRTQVEVGTSSRCPVAGIETPTNTPSRLACSLSALASRKPGHAPAHARTDQCK